MDLLQSVRKEGSRGGVDFKWDDVKSSQHRENYLGHSLMAPVGRWQKGKDLNWYAKGDSAEKTAEEREAEERELRKAELRKIKEAEEDAMARALGLPVPDRSANTEPLGESKIDQKDVKAALREALDDDNEEEHINAMIPEKDAIAKKSTAEIDQAITDIVQEATTDIDTTEEIETDHAVETRDVALAEVTAENIDDEEAEVEAGLLVEEKGMTVVTRNVGMIDEETRAETEDQ